MTPYQKFKERCFSIIGNKCVKCDSTKNLQIDHIIPEEKLFSLATSWGKKTWEQQEAELKKCQPLCYDHHLEKTKIDLSRLKKKDRDKCHGTESQYTRYKCRCSICVIAYKAARKLHKSRQSKKVHQKAICGTNSMYRNGCRCSECKKAHCETVKAYNKKEKESCLRI